MKNVPTGFTSKIFNVENIKLADKNEQIVKGGKFWSHLANHIQAVTYLTSFPRPSMASKKLLWLAMAPRAAPRRR